MAEEAGFHEREIDRTAYAALWSVAITVIIAFAAGTYLLFQAGTLIRHLRLPATPSIGLPNPASAVQSAKDRADAAAKQAADAAQNSAKQAATQKLNQFLSP